AAGAARRGANGHVGRGRRGAGTRCCRRTRPDRRIRSSERTRRGGRAGSVRRSRRTGHCGRMRYAHGMPFGAEVTGNGVRFRIWAPAARAAHVHVDGRSRAMETAGRGFFEYTDAEAGPGSRYAFSFDGDDRRVPDPASRFNPSDVHGPSEVVDPCAYTWRTGGWRGRPWHEAVLYELHVGTFTAAGTYAAA